MDEGPNRPGGIREGAELPCDMLFGKAESMLVDWTGPLKFCVLWLTWLTETWTLAEPCSRL